MREKYFHPHLTYTDFKEGKFDKAVLAVGSAENHGFICLARYFGFLSHCRRSSQKVEGLLVLPPVTYGEFPL